MAELTATSPAQGQLPLTLGDVTLTELPHERLTSVQPFADVLEAVDGHIREAFGSSLPKAGASAPLGGGRVLWFGKETYLMVGAEVPVELSEYAAISDQSDAWARLALSGTSGVDVLARLVPVDLRAGRFPPGSVCRTLVGHLQACLYRKDQNTFEIMVFRSMAHTLIEELGVAMSHVAARSGNLPA